MKRIILSLLLITLLFPCSCSKPEGKIVKGKFVFTSTRREGPGAYLMRDGKIKTLGVGLAGPVWSNDGKLIATAGQEIADKAIIFNEFGGKIKEVKTPNLALYMSWGKNNNRIAYAAANPDLKDEYGSLVCNQIFIYIFNTNKSQKIYEGDNNDEIMNLSFSPDNRKLVFRSQRDDDKRGSYVINTDGTGLKRISKYGTNPCWFPDGEHIFIVNDQRDNSTYYHNGKASYFKVDADTGEVVEELLHEPVAVGFTPRLSDDGKYVITDKQIGGGRAIVIIPLYGERKGENIPIYPKEEFGYDLSPDWYQE